MRDNSIRRMARVGVAIASTLAMTGLPAVVPSVATQALASGTVTIAKTPQNGSISYKAYLVFNGTVDPTNSKRISNITWSSTAMEDAVWSAINTVSGHPTKPTNAAESAQVAAEFIANNIKAGNAAPPSADQNYILPDDSFGKKLSDAIRTLNATDTLQPGVAKTLNQDGYYLFLTDPSSINGQSTGTSPIFTVVGGGNTVSITEKTTVPTLVKDLQLEDGTWGKATDREMGGTVRYRVTTTLPSNLATYTTYHHKVTDTLPAGLTPVANSIVVKAYPSAAAAASDSGSTTLSGGVTAAFSGQNLSVDISNVRSLTFSGGGSLNSDSVIVVYYDATVNANMTQGKAGNANGAKLTFTHDPNAGGEGETSTDGTKVYNYSLRIHKQDKAVASRPLQNAKFTLQLKTDDHTSGNNGKYVQANGSLGSSAYEFTTDANGEFLVKGLDSGTYILKETTAPPTTNGAAYDVVPDTEITINGNPDTTTMQVAPSQQESKFTLSAAVTGSSDVLVDGTANANTGLVPVVVKDTKKVLMPLTGQEGILVFVGLGTLTAIVAVRLLAPGKKKGDGEDKE